MMTHASVSSGSVDYTLNYALSNVLVEQGSLNDSGHSVTDSAVQLS